MQSKTIPIQVFLPDGESTGVRIAEIKNGNVELVAFPRSKLGAVKGIDKEGVYFLFGTDEHSGDRPSVYIGQAKNCINRIKQHDQDPNKDYWNEAAVFITKDRSFGTTEIEYLEQLSVNQAKIAYRFLVKNDKIPPSSSLSHAQKAQMTEVFEWFELLLSVIGRNVLIKPINANASHTTFYCEGAGVKARAEYTDAGMVVLKGSQMRKDATPTLGKGVVFLRSTLVAWDIVKEEGANYFFVEDYPFTSPSTAAQAILGRSENGWNYWKSLDGKTMNEVVRSNN